MAIWVLHQHPELLRWVNDQNRAGHMGLRLSFDAACTYSENDSNWANRSGDCAFVDYLPGPSPFTFPMILKLRVGKFSITAVGVFVERGGLCKNV
ncbi:hypothetical protein [Azospirillum sp. Sh1]|uniref:hypothetical protein n=1 Tax=Azospirillum sp. Sh1 TaxID=2607285 RepID=UPI0011EC4838|nr:hypothetical protein [Azospirillum sp. Sh1]KAA0578136.1 hypothetical protein FZ029_09700 [Azospirillum sp. Sh1]